MAFVDKVRDGIVDIDRRLAAATDDDEFDLLFVERQRLLMHVEQMHGADARRDLEQQIDQLKNPTKSRCTQQPELPEDVERESPAAFTLK